MAELDTNISNNNELVNTIQDPREESFKLIKAKQKALEEAKRIAEEVRREFDRNIKEVQEVASRIFIEATGRLQDRFEEIEKEADEFTAESNIEIQSDDTVKATKTKEIKSAKGKGRITKAIDKLKRSTHKPQKNPSSLCETKEQIGKVAGETRGKITKILDRVSKLKQQVEESKEEVDKSIEKIEEKIGKTIASIREHSEKGTEYEYKADSLHHFEQLVSNTEKEINHNLADLILNHPNKEIRQEDFKLIDEKLELLKLNLEGKEVQTTLSKKLPNKETKEIKISSNTPKASQNKGNKKQTVDQKKPVAVPKKEVRIDPVPETNGEQKKVTIVEQAEAPTTKRENKLHTKKDLERTFAELKEQAARFSEIADIDLRKAIDNIKRITGKIPRKQKSNLKDPVNDNSSNQQSILKKENPKQAPPNKRSKEAKQATEPRKLSGVKKTVKPKGSKNEFSKESEKIDEETKKPNIRLKKLK